jgi:hypothetical protein
MNSAVAPMVIANLIATACALMLVRRGPSPRLRLLTLTVGLMSLAQTTHFLHTQGIWTGGRLYMESIHHMLVAALSLLAIYLLGTEIYDRNLTDRRLRLAEHEMLTPNPAPPVQRKSNGEVKEAPAKAEKTVKEQESVGELRVNGRTAPLVVTPVEPVRRNAMHDSTVCAADCEECLAIVKRIANAWSSLYEELHAKAEGRNGVPSETSKYELVSSLRARLEHSMRSGHSVI